VSPVDPLSTAKATTNATALFSETPPSSISTAGFGDVVRPRYLEKANFGSRPVPTEASAATLAVDNNNNNNNDEQQVADTIKRRNFAVALASVGVAILNYLWQFTHPLSPVQLLVSMQASSAPVSVIGSNGKPTVVDFWAPVRLFTGHPMDAARQTLPPHSPLPSLSACLLACFLSVCLPDSHTQWCENCKLTAPTLRQVEEEYKDRVNFVMVDGDKRDSWDLIEAFGVDAIPHLALVSADGDVETALIGPIPKSVLEADLEGTFPTMTRARPPRRSDLTVTLTTLHTLDCLYFISLVLISNAQLKENSPAQVIPYRMMDVFAQNPARRRVHFDP
jgi:thiol-disulfide isomerase/thioredoxin